MYLHLLVSASQNEPRGQVDANAEDIASALDIEASSVAQIIDAMQGRVLDGKMVTGWDKRQPTKEDNSAERTRQWRERHKASQISRDDSSVSVTTNPRKYSPF